MVENLVCLPFTSWHVDTHGENQSKSTGSSKESLNSLPIGIQNPEDHSKASDLSKTESTTSAQSCATDQDQQIASRQTSRSEHRSSLGNALRGSLSRSSSRGSSPSRGPAHPHRTLSGTQAGQISLDAAVGAGKSIKQIVGTSLKSPMDFTLSIARGFHNAPKLYGDESVRQADKVTGLQSGLKAASKVDLHQHHVLSFVDLLRNLDLVFMTVSLGW